MDRKYFMDLAKKILDEADPNLYWDLPEYKIYLIADFLEEAVIYNITHPSGSEDKNHE